MKKQLIWLTLFFIFLNILFFFFNHYYKSNLIERELQEKTYDMELSYKQILKFFDQTAAISYAGIIKNTKVIGILKQVEKATPEEKDRLRLELFAVLKDRYENLQKRGVLQNQFVLPDNTSFLRMHKPDIYGDSLTGVRYSFESVHQHKKRIDGFEHGKTAHGFRYVFPLFDEKQNYLCAVEISFGSEEIQKNMNEVFNMHTHFIINKSVFKTESWERDDLKLNYIQSIESEDYLFTPDSSFDQNKFHNTEKQLIQPMKVNIQKKLPAGKSFQVYREVDKQMRLITFLPIKDIEHQETQAYLVSYTTNDFIKQTLMTSRMLGWMFFIASALIFVFIYRFLKTKQIKDEREHLLHTIMDNTDQLILISDLTKIKFANHKLLEFFNVSGIDELQTKFPKTIDMFLEVDGYLHKNLLKENETLIDLIERTKESERIACLIDSHFEHLAFVINIAQSNYNDLYIITLTDITKMKEESVQIEKKAYIDGLTGVYNRNKFNETISSEFNRAKRYKSSLSMAILDIDKFKDFNDIYGHLVGDEVLISIAQTINSEIRNTDTFARWGGEEFVILFPGTSLENAKVIADKLRVRVQKIKHPTAKNITVSFGVSEYRDGDSVDSLFQRCDEAMYRAKEHGRNRVESL